MTSISNIWISKREQLISIVLFYERINGFHMHKFHSQMTLFAISPNDRIKALKFHAEDDRKISSAFEWMERKNMDKYKLWWQWLCFFISLNHSMRQMALNIWVNGEYRMVSILKIFYNIVLNVTRFTIGVKVVGTFLFHFQFIYSSFDLNYWWFTIHNSSDTKLNLVSDIIFFFQGSQISTRDCALV